MRGKTQRSFTTKIYAFLAVFFWGSAFVSTKILLQTGSLSAMDLGTLRYFIAGILLVPLAYFCKVRLPKARDFGKFTLAGFLGYTVYIFFFNTASTVITPSTASVINAICPGLTAVFGYFIFREKISLQGVLALVVSFVGILVLSLWGGKLSLNIGVVYMLGAAFCLSAYNITQRCFVQRYKAMEVMTYSLLSGTLLLVVFHSSSLRLLGTLNGETWGHLVYLAVFPSIISYYCWAKAMDCCRETTEVTNFMFVTPIVASCLSFLLIKEFPHTTTYVGGGLILFGMILFQKNKIPNS